MVMEKPTQNFTGDNLKEALEHRKEYEHYFDKIIVEGIENQEFDGIDVRTFLLIILGALNGTLQWYSAAGPKSAEEFAELFADHMLKFVVKQKKISKD